MSGGLLALALVPGLSKSGRRRGWAPGEQRGRPEVCSRRSPRTRRPQRSSVVWRWWQWQEQRRERSWPRRCRRWEFSEHLVPRYTQELLGGPEREGEKKKILPEHMCRFIKSSNNEHSVCWGEDEPPSGEGQRRSMYGGRKGG